jgi:hypothetical protein
MEKDNNTRMALCSELMGLVKAGLKKITIRDGYRNIRIGPAFFSTPDGSEEVQVYVTKVVHCALYRASTEELLMDGYDDLTDAVAGLKKFYPDLRSGSEVTIIHFKL